MQAEEQLVLQDLHRLGDAHVVESRRSSRRSRRVVLSDGVGLAAISAHTAPLVPAALLLLVHPLAAVDDDAAVDEITGACGHQLEQLLPLALRLEVAVSIAEVAVRKAHAETVSSDRQAEGGAFPA
eukprot:scaffold114833_cov51-Phaeocystis_antarctica.AAC.3